MPSVALYARAWVEMMNAAFHIDGEFGRPLREGVGRNPSAITGAIATAVALYARAWVEIA